MTFQTHFAPISSPQWMISGNPEIFDLISSMSRSICLDIEGFYEALCDKNGLINPEKIPASEFFSYPEPDQSYDTFKAPKGISTEEIFEFLASLHDEFKFSPECLILTMMYISKFSKCSKIPLMKGNWKNIVLMSILLAQKVSESTLISSSDFKTISGFCLDDINFMEIEYLNIIGYNFKLEAIDYANQVSYLQDISKSAISYSWHFGNEKLKSIIKRSEWLTEEEIDDKHRIYRSKAMIAINLDEIDYI